MGKVCLFSILLRLLSAIFFMCFVIIYFFLFIYLFKYLFFLLKLLTIYSSSSLESLLFLFNIRACLVGFGGRPESLSTGFAGFLVALRGLVALDILEATALVSFLPTAVGQCPSAP